MRNKFLGTGQPGYHPVRKVKTVLSGLRYAALYDFSVGYKLALSAVLVSAAFWARQWVDVLLIVFATALVLIAEMLNTAIEALCDFVEGRHNEKIGIIKDISAAAVGVSIAVWLLIVTVEAVRLWTR
ncbi:MAG: diacylglycerol kinase [Burkholderiales bacterium]